MHETMGIGTQQGSGRLSTPLGSGDGGSRTRVQKIRAGTYYKLSWPFASRPSCRRSTGCYPGQPIQGT